MRSLQVLAIVVALTSSPTAGPQAAGIARVGWLQGCWSLTSGDRTVEEHWLAPRGGSMIGVGRTVRGAQLIEYELVVLREQQGLLAYEAHPSGQQPATFTSIEITPARVVFENKTHDFPQRVGYERRGDSLTAWVEGPAGQAPVRKIEFPYRKVGCDE